MSTSDNATADEERGDFADRKPVKSPAQKGVNWLLIALAVAILLYFGLKYAGVFDSKQKVAHVEEQKRPDSTPDFNVSLGEPPKPEPQFIECSGGLKLPLGMDCPPTVGPEIREAEHRVEPEKPKGPTEEELLQKRRFESEIDVTSKGPAEHWREAVCGLAVSGQGLVFHVQRQADQAFTAGDDLHQLGQPGR